MHHERFTRPGVAGASTHTIGSGRTSFHFLQSLIITNCTNTNTNVDVHVISIWVYLL